MCPTGETACNGVCVNLGADPSACQPGPTADAGRGDVLVGCMISEGGSGACDGFLEMPDQVSAQQAGCESQGGTFLDGQCPTAGLIGCCVYAAIELCYYGDSSLASDFQQTCPSNWSTTPTLGSARPADGGTPRMDGASAVAEAGLDATVQGRDAGK